MSSTTKEYYALCVRFEDGEEYEVAPLHLGRNELGTVIAFAIYSSEDGPHQREDLEKYEGDMMIRKVSPRELLDAYERYRPTSVFADGRKYAGSVLSADLKMELGLPIREPRLLFLDEDEDDSLDQEETSSPGQNPKIIGPPEPDIRMKWIQKAIGKTISEIEFGVVEGLPGGCMRARPWFFTSPTAPPCP